MDRDTETALLDELVELRRDRRPFVTQPTRRSPVQRHTDPERFAQERARIFHAQPMLVALSGELPEDVDRTRIRFTTLRPDPGRPLTDEETLYWTRNHALTTQALHEDFGFGERIQEGLETGANTHLTFGGFEGALFEFHEGLEAFLAS
ncbi:MAG: hypothetical protein AAF211_32525 [Myxococcota bacterium]